MNHNIQYRHYSLATDHGLMDVWELFTHGEYPQIHRLFVLRSIYSDIKREYGLRDEMDPNAEDDEWAYTLLRLQKETDDWRIEQIALLNGK